MTGQLVDSEPAFVLHARDYRETSQLVDLFSRHHGRLRLVARGSRRRRVGSRPLEAFVPLVVAWRGKSDLKTLTGAEPSGQPLTLLGDSLYIGFYLNELLLRLLAEHDPHQVLFDRYLYTLRQLSTGECVETALRTFERSLLSELGYGPVLTLTEDSGEAVNPQAWYWFDPDTGVSCRPGVEVDPSVPNWFRGSELLAIDTEDYSDPAVAKAAKRLMRLAIHSLLGGRPLHSRALFARHRLQ